MTIFKIWCEWEMSGAQGYYTTKEKAQKAIDNEDWSLCGYTLEEVEEAGLVGIEEIEVY